MSRQLQLGIVVAFLIVYGSSFFLVVEGQTIAGDVYGGTVFRLAFEELLSRRLNGWLRWSSIAAWFANPLYWFACIATLCRYPRIAILFSTSAALHALPLLCSFLPNGTGYYVWLGSAFILLAGNGYLIRRQNK